MDMRAKSGGPERAKKYVGYARVSTQGQDLGLDVQRAAIEKHVAEQGGELVGLIEEKESGKKAGRKGLREAISLAQASGAVLLISKLDRLSREVSLVFALREAGLEFEVIGMPSLNSLTLAVLAGMAQHERELISARTKDGLAAAKARGARLGNPQGFSAAARARLIESRRENAMENEANQTGRKHIEMFLKDGHSMNEIARRLTALGIATPRGGKWSAAAVSRLMKLYGIEKGVRK